MIIKAEVVWRVLVTIDVEPSTVEVMRDRIISHAYLELPSTMPQITKCDEIPEVVSV